MTVLLLTSIFISSFLIFQIQPLLAKYLLPWFGGSAGVWAASLLLFQILLAVGYGYAHLLTSTLSRKRQGYVHLGLLVVSIGLLAANWINWGSPILPNQVNHTSNVRNPVIEVVQSLFSSIGFPYILLASNSTLTQTWFVTKKPRSSPYPLYAVSNAGSLVGLISYPFIIEPLFRIVSQSFIWAAGYLLFILTAGYHAISCFLGKPDHVDKKPDRNQENKKKLGGKHILLWIFLPGLASLLLLATTNQLTQDVASIPFLWVLPLSVYLIAFILVFSSGKFYRRIPFIGLLLVCSILYVWFVELSTTGILYQIVLYTVLLFVCSMICLGELYHLRPEPDSISLFYLLLSIGGVLGGGLVNFVFPYIYNGLWEYQLGIGGVWILVFYLTYTQPVSDRYYVTKIFTGLVGFATIIVFSSLYLKMESYQKDAIVSRRNFYGTLRVLELAANNPDEHKYLFMNGITTHGSQFAAIDKRSIPTTYYGVNSGIGIVFQNHPNRTRPLRAGFIGLGIGVLASYGREGDQFWFYEINPDVLEIAQGEYFTFIDDSPADINILVGDGRVILENKYEQLGSMNFDLLVLDAFNSGSIPTHLLTVEAINLYLNHISNDGLLAIHISNRFLNLAPIIWQAADVVGIDGTTFIDTTNNDFTAPSRWVVLTNNQEFLSNKEVQKRDIDNDPFIINQQLWTDNYTNLVAALKN